MQVLQTRLEKPTGMMPRVIEDDPVERLTLGILDQLADRRLHVVRVTDQQNLGTFECSKVPRKIAPRSIRLHEHKLGRLN